MVRASTRGQIGAAGETAVALQFEQLGWGVAANPTQHDLGTDLWLQARDDRRFDLGALVGAQVKTGSSWFRNPSHDDEGKLVGWWFSDSDGHHVKYWTDHRVPHLLILHSQESGVSYWVHVTKGKVVSTGKGVKILVPELNTVDSDHVGDLVRVAVSDRNRIQWEGSTWGSGKSVLRADRLRHALLTPRLIAPHPNRTVTEFTAEAAIALLIKMRLRDLAPDKRRGIKAPSVDEARASNEWAWRLYAATYDDLVNGMGSEGVQALIDTADEPFERAAAAAIACALLVEEGKPERGLEVVTSVLDRDDSEPIDHAWLLMHKARCLAELGNLEQAHGHAVEVQSLRGTSLQDATVMAIVGSSSDLIFSISGWRSGNMSTAITGRDTLAAWWRTQEVAWGLQHHWNATFKLWAHDDRRTFGSSDVTWLRLRAASLIAGTTADHSAWRHTAGMLAERILTTAESDTGHSASTEALGLLRLVGDSESVKLAVRHLLRVGPVEAVIKDASSVDLALSTRTSIRADLEMLRYAADVLPSENIDKHTRWLLDVLQDARHFVERLRPTFSIEPIILDTLSDLMASASEAVIREVIDHIVALPPQDDQGSAHHYVTLMNSIPDGAWTDLDLRALAARDGSDNFELIEAINILLAEADSGVREAQRTRIASGDLAALRAFGDVRDLDSDTVKALVADLTGKISSEIHDLVGGQHATRSVDFASTLILINRWHPTEANWDPIVSILTVETLFSEHLREPLKQLKQLGAGIPGPIADVLVPILREIMTNPPRSHPFFGSPDVSGDAAAALAEISPDAITDPELWHLLNGNEQRRVAAVRVIASRNNPSDLTTLAVLAKDPATRVRAQVAFSLARWIAQGVAVQLALELLAHVLNDPGTLVAQAVAAQLAQTQPSDATSFLVEMLKDHQSSTVRHALHEHESASWLHE